MPTANRPHAERVGPYRLLRQLGVGGMGETYEAQLEDGGVSVCLKVIRPELAGNPRYVRMFQDETRLHAQLVHENIVRVLDTGEGNGVPYLVLEMVDGTSLDNLLAHLTSRGEKAPVGASAYILLCLSRALEAAHTFTIAGNPQSLVHRDVSPSNVLISRTGDVKLSDFGIAKSLAREPHTTAGVVRGKFAYMSPEQTRGEPLDQRSDLFALGVIAYELFTGSHPFRVGREENEIMTAHRMLLGERDPLLHRAPWLPAALREATERLLEPERARRLPEARALVGALEELPQQREGKAALQRLVTRAVRFTPRVVPEDATHSLPEADATPRLRAGTNVAAVATTSRSAMRVERYLSSLPDGFASYPSCQAKGSLVRAYLASKPLSLDDVPGALRETVSHPPVSGSFIPEVNFLSLALAVRARHFDDDDAFLAWVKALNMELFRGPLYRALMLVGTTRMLAAGAALRWRQFHRGTTLIAQHGTDASLDLSFRFPHGLFTLLHVRLFGSAIEAAVEAAGASHARTASFSADATTGRVLITW